LFFLIFGGGGMVIEVLKNFNRTRVEMATLRSQQHGVEGMKREMDAMRSEIDALRTQVTSLRDTTTQYDLSFDTALHRIESRIDRVEQQNQRIGA
ncbi:MAG TPA: hypothetical protein VGS41_16020, partial [Chthonomonadales bacterium]|nr:hypothetical protein [Chthonomonadales bacterium]